MNITVSVVIPTYNRCNLLDEAIKSVNNQNTRFGVEIVVIDDCSTEDISAICRKYGCNYYRLDKRKGAQFARNFGVQHANGRYIEFLDSDDVLLNRNTLQIQAELLESNQEMSFVFTDKFEINGLHDQIPESDTTRIKIKLIKNIRKKLLKRDFIGSYSGVMVKKKEFEIVHGCDISLPARQDWDLWLRLGSRGITGHFKAPMTGYRNHHDQISNSAENKIIGTITLLNKHSDMFSDTIINRFWKYYHCSRIIIASSLSSFDISRCSYQNILLLKKYVENRKWVDPIINSKLLFLLLKLVFKRSYFFKGIFR